jgi:hypothetical protein
MAPRVGITDTAAAQAARDLGCTQAQARAFLEKQAPGGRVVASDQLPPPYRGKRSQTDRFLLIDHMLALPLAMDRRDPSGFSATGCLIFKEYLRANGRARPAPDPYTLSGVKLMEQVRLSEHAVQRYQQRAGGHPNPNMPATRCVGSSRGMPGLCGSGPGGRNPVGARTSSCWRGAPTARRNSVSRCPGTVAAGNRSTR